MDDAAFQSVLARMAPPTGPQQPTQAPAPQAPAQQPQSDDASDYIFEGGGNPADRQTPAAPPDDTAGGMFPKGGQFANPNATPEPGLSDPSAPFVDAPVSGIAKAVYETHDFVAGETPQDQRSAIRKAIEAGPGAANQGLGYSLSEGIFQFGTGMLGAGKIMEAARGAKALDAAYQTIHGVRGGATAIEAAKAASVGAVAFDPHQERLSNLVQSYPALANPITNFLAAKADDSGAEGRLKNAMESLGMDASMGVLMAGLKVYKAMRVGDAEGVKAGEAEVHQAMEKAGQAEKPAADPSAPGGEPAAPPTATNPEPLAPAVGDPLGGQPGVAFQEPLPAPAAESPYTHTPSESGGHFAPSELVGDRDQGLSGIYYKTTQDGAAQIDNAGLPEAMRGQGKGAAMYQAFVDQMHGDGRDVSSDMVTSPSASRMYAKLKASGYDVGENPNVHITPDGGRLTTDGQPVFTVRRPNPDARTVVDDAGRSFTKSGPGEPYKFDAPTPAMPAPSAIPHGLLDEGQDWADMIRKLREQHAPEPITSRGGVTVQPDRSTTLKDFFANDRQPHPDSSVGQTYGIAKKLLSRAGDVPVHFLSDDAMRHYWDSLNHPTVKGASGFYEPNQRFIAVRSSDMADPQRGASLMLHEATHAALHRIIETNTSARASLDGLLTVINRELGKRQSQSMIAQPSWYGLSNAHELVSEAMSNPAFQKMLSSIKLPPGVVKSLGLDGTTRPTLWDAFVAKVKKVLGFSGEQATALDGVLRIADLAQKADDRRAWEAHSGAQHNVLASPQPEVESVKNATDANDGERPPGRFKPMDVSPEEATSIFHGMSSDADAFMKYGSWDEAVESGHVFGKGGSIPYQHLAGGQNELGAFITRNSEVLKEHLDDLKGGAVYSDQAADALVRQRVQLYGEDPAALLGLIQKAGQDANGLIANMETSYLVSQRAYQDAYVLAGKIKVGALDEYGGMHDGAMEHLRQMLQVANEAWGAGQSMRAAMGRGMRRLRAAPDPAFVDAVRGLDDNSLVTMLQTAGGDPRLLKTAMQPGLLKRAQDWTQFLYVNNLLWGLRTHFVNFSTNGYLLVGRPLERIVGSLVQSRVGGADAASDALRIRQEAQKQYEYMWSSVSESWKAAVETWRTGDSMLHPHHNEVTNAGVNSSPSAIGHQVAQMPFKPWDSTANVLHNAFLVAAPKTLGAPTRAIGAADELVQQVAYRSKVQSKAFVEGKMQGLDGDALKLYVKNRLYDAFDDAGRGIDADALREAKVVAFQQDLLPDTLGKAVQTAVGNTGFFGRFILPFVKTPTNVIRLGWKMTPGLNLAQTEYRQMLRGELGPEQQAQAIGQMAMGSLFASTAAAMSLEGRITGGGPSDPQALAALEATGWKPYSFVIVHSDGSRTYINYGRYDPVAMVFGIVADIVNVLSAEPDSRLIQQSGTAIQAALIGIAKNITSKTYLKSLDDTIQMLQSPDKNAARFLGTYSANMVPMSAGMRFANQVALDPVLRESRTYVDYILATLPGASKSLPVKRDAWGDPEMAHPGLWTDYPGGLVDGEVRRMNEKPGDSERLQPPSPNFRGGVDLRDVTMQDGSNAYDKLQQYARQPSPGVKPVKQAVHDLMMTPGYQAAPDGDSRTRGTKMAMITGVMSRYRQAAERMMMADANVRQAAFQKAKAVQAAYANRAGQANPTTPNNEMTAMSRLTHGLTSLVSPMMGRPSQ